MQKQKTAYHVQIMQDKNHLRAYFRCDVALHAYALGDLPEAMWQVSRFVGVFVEDQLEAVGLIWSGATPPAVLLFGRPEAVSALIEAGELPQEIFYMVTPPLRDILENAYVLDGRQELWRMVVTPNNFVQGAGHTSLQRLSGIHAQAVDDLLTARQNLGQNRIILTPEKLEGGLFFGIFENAQLVAMAGTHVFAPEEGVGAVGFVFTDVTMRGRGFAKITSGAVTQAFFDAGISTVVLNVTQDNIAAIRAYERLGYRIYAPIMEGLAHRQSP